LSDNTRGVLYRRWVHSHEEDTPTEMVFRPETWSFPPSRGRIGFELRADGSFVDLAIAPSDVPEESEGRWELRGDTLYLHSTPSAPTGRALKVIVAEPNRLTIAKGAR
jgi:hypothetical protein